MDCVGDYCCGVGADAAVCYSCQCQLCVGKDAYTACFKNERKPWVSAGGCSSVFEAGFLFAAGNLHDLAADIFLTKNLPSCRIFLYAQFCV